MPYDPYEEVFEDSNKELSESEQQQLQQDIEDKLQTLEDTNQIQQEVVDVEPQDNQVEDVINSIKSSAYSGKIGDGKIFVSNIEQVIRIRTGEKDSEAV